MAIIIVGIIYLVLQVCLRFAVNRVKSQNVDDVFISTIYQNIVIFAYFNCATNTATTRGKIQKDGDKKAIYTQTLTHVMFNVGNLLIKLIELYTYLVVASRTIEASAITKIKTKELITGHDNIKSDWN